MGILGELITAENVTLAVAIWLVMRLEWTRSELQTLSQTVKELSQTVKEQGQDIAGMRELLAHMAAKLDIEWRR